MTYREEDYTTDIVAKTLSDGSVAYVATHPELDGCMAHGDTEQEARENLREAFALMVAHLKKYELPVPPPKSSYVQALVLQAYTPQAGTGSGLAPFRVIESTMPVSFSLSNISIMPDRTLASLYFGRPITASIVQLGVPPKVLETAS